MADAKVILYAENRIKEGIDSAKGDLTGFQSAAQKVGDTLKSALTVTAIIAGLKELGKAAFDAYTEFGEAERRAKQLTIALNETGGSVEKNTNLIDEMAKKSLSSKDDIEQLVAELASLGKSDKDIDRIMNAAVNLSNVTGKDLNSSFQTIMGTFDGTTGKLNKLVPEVSNLSKEQLKAGDAADIINKKFGEMSDKLSEDDIPQKLKNMNDKFSELKENLGAATAPVFTPIIDGINSIITSWNNAMKAADNYNKIQTAVGYNQLINAKKQALSSEKSRLAEMEATPNFKKGTMSPLDKAAYETQKAKITQLEAEITDLNKQWGQTQTSLLKKGDIIETTGVPKPSKTSSSSSSSGSSGSSSSSKNEEPEWMKAQRSILGVEPTAENNLDIDEYFKNKSQEEFDLVKLGYQTEEEALTKLRDDIKSDIERLIRSGQFKADDSTIQYMQSLVDRTDNTLINVAKTKTSGTNDAGNKPENKPADKPEEPEWKKVERRILGVEPTENDNLDVTEFYNKTYNQQFDEVALGVKTETEAWNSLKSILEGKIESLIESGQFNKDSSDVIALNELLKSANDNIDKIAKKNDSGNKPADKPEEPEWKKVERRILGVEPTENDNLDVTEFYNKTYNQQFDEVALGVKTETEALYSLRSIIKDKIESLIESGQFNKDSSDVIALNELFKSTDEKIGKIEKKVDTGNKSEDKPEESEKDKVQRMVLGVNPTPNDNFDIDEYYNKLYNSQYEQVKAGILTEKEALRNISGDIESAIAQLLESGQFKAEDSTIQYLLSLYNNAVESITKITNSAETGISSITKAVKNDIIDSFKEEFKTQGVYGQSGIAPPNSGISISKQMQGMINNSGLNIQKILSGIGQDVTGAIGGLGQAGSGLLDSILGSGLSGAGAMEGITGALAPLLSAVEPLTQILFSANPILAALIPIIEGFVGVIAPILSDVIQPLMDALKGIGVTIAQLIIPIFNALYPSIALIANIVTTVVTPILQLLSPILQYTTIQFQVLIPIIQLLTQVITILISPVKYVSDLFNWLGQWISALGQNIGIAIYNITHPTAMKSFVSGPGSFTSDAFTGLKKRLDEIGNVGPADFGLTGTAGTTTSSGASASYTGGNTITINIYQQAPVVGDAGMTEFARMIRNEFLELDYYNA